jgi:signal transduction histidine kinase
MAEQVMINLVRNSLYALEKVPGGCITLSAEERADNVVIKVEDNGPGIEPAVIKDIFLPFFTTRQDGLGIGLSLSRQIMNLHGGTLTAESQPGIRTAFNMVFPK